MTSFVGFHDVGSVPFERWFSEGNFACVAEKQDGCDVLKVLPGWGPDGGKTLGRLSNGQLGPVADDDPARYCSIEGNIVFYNAVGGLGRYAFVNHLVNA